MQARQPDKWLPSQYAGSPHYLDKAEAEHCVFYVKMLRTAEAQIKRQLPALEAAITNNRWFQQDYDWFQWQLDIIKGLDDIGYINRSVDKRQPYGNPDAIRSNATAIREAADMLNTWLMHPAKAPWNANPWKAEHKPYHQSRPPRPSFSMLKIKAA